MKTICDYCKAEIERSPSLTIGHKHHFCNRKCYGKWLSEYNKGENHPFYGKHHTEEAKQKISKNIPIVRGKDNPHFGKHLNEEHKKKLSKAHKGKKHTEEVKKKIGLSGKKHPMFGKHHTEEAKQKMREARKNVKMPNTHSLPERKFEEICKKYGLPFRYVGDSSLWVGEKGGKKLNPDFIEANGKKIVVEIFGDYWHSPLRNPRIRKDANLNYRKAHYKKYGWESIFIWETDLKREDAEQFVLSNFKK